MEQMCETDPGDAKGWIMPPKVLMSELGEIAKQEKGLHGYGIGRSCAPLRLRQSRTLTPLILVRIQVLQPQNLSITAAYFRFLWSPE